MKTKIISQDSGLKLILNAVPMLSLFSLQAQGNGVLESNYKLPLLNGTVQSVSSTRVENFDDESTLAIIGSENVHSHNLSFFGKGPLSASLRDKSLVLEFSNQKRSIEAKLCEPLVDSDKLSCATRPAPEAKQHPQFQDGLLFNIDSIEVSLINPKMICRGAATCSLTIPSFTLQAMSRRDSIDMPRIVSVALLEEKLQIIDGQRGVPLVTVHALPNEASVSSLGRIVAMDAQHRGWMKIQFQSGILHVNLLSERGLFAGSDGRVYTGKLTSHESQWLAHQASQTDLVKSQCTGQPLDASLTLAVYKDCLVNLTYSPTNQSLLTKLLKPALPAIAFETKLAGVRGLADGSSRFRGWNVNKGKVDIFELEFNDDSLSQRRIQSLPFHGRGAGEIEFFSDKVFRSTAEGHYLISENEEIKTSLPFSDVKTIFSNNGKGVLLAFKDAQKNNVCKHMILKNQSAQNWHETGFEFPCKNYNISVSADSITLTKVKGGKVEIISLKNE